jgi:hypothetical protein
MKYYQTDHIIFTMDKKTLILQFISQNPGVKSIDINVGLGRASIGAHARALMDAGMLIRDASYGWHIAEGFIVKIDPKPITPIDIAAEHIRKMIELR